MLLDARQLFQRTSRRTSFDEDLMGLVTVELLDRLKVLNAETLNRPIEDEFLKMFRTVCDTVKKRIQRAATRFHSLDPQCITQVAPVDPQIEEMNLRARLAEALNANDQLLLSARLDGLTFEEIAIQLGLKISTVHRRMQSIRQRLIEQIQAE